MFSPNPEYARRTKIGVRIGVLEERVDLLLCVLSGICKEDKRIGGLEEGVDRALG